MAAISHRFTARLAAEKIGVDEDTVWKLAEGLDPEDACLWVHDINGEEMLAFTEFGIETIGYRLEEFRLRPW